MRSHVPPLLFLEWSRRSLCKQHNLLSVLCLCHQEAEDEQKRAREEEEARAEAERRRAAEERQRVSTFAR